MDKLCPVVIPLGSCEQHGPHLPVLVDSIQVSAIVDELERRMAERVLFTPTLWLGSSHHHLDFAGTISIRPSLYSQVIQDIAISILRSGFTRIFFLNGHGGNETPAAQAISELVAQDERANTAHLAMASWWQVASDRMKPEQHGMATEALSHACEYETSLMLFLRPELVDQAKAQDVDELIKTPWTNYSSQGGRIRVFHRFIRLTTSGNLGKPSRASAAKGESIFYSVVGEIAQFLDDFSHWP